MNIRQSIFGLAKTNNGFFKSEKQAAFLISQLQGCDGYLGAADSGYNSCPIFCTWDEKGITAILKHSQTNKGCKPIPMFERKIEGALTALELKQIKYCERKIKELQKSIINRDAAFKAGEYNEYTEKDENGMTLYERGKKWDENMMQSYTATINKIKGIS